MNLYLKYRPKTIDELDLSGVRKTLSEMVKANNLAHAYLLTGPRGAGKTSTARVLARVVNCEKNGEKLGEPCNDCSACTSILNGGAMDVIEIDAASNRGIDDVRELKEKIRLAPSILRTKVYIIDEVHMMTTEAFNALLKTLEEPPSHSLFILCTTELHKVPETIVSRCVQVQFTKATAEEMKRSFKRVIKGEEKEVSDEALEYLAKSVDGSFRDGVKILDQVLSNSDKVTLSDIEQVVSGSVGYKIESLAAALANKDVTEALLKLNEAITNGVDLTYLLLSLMRSIRDMLLTGSIAVEATKLIFSLDEVARRLATSLDGELLIQVAIVEWCGSTGKIEQGTRISNIEKHETKIVVTKEEKIVTQAEPTKSQSSELPSATLSTAESSEPLVTEDGQEVWKQIIGSLGQNNLALDTILSKARPGNIHGDELTVYVQYDFHKQQLMSEKNRAKFEGIITKAVGRPMRVRCEIGDTKTMQGSNQVKPEAVETQDGTIDEAMSIFTS
jgi:DNA polymerase-3 subunit gamma/tau